MLILQSQNMTTVPCEFIFEEAGTNMVAAIRHLPKLAEVRRTSAQRGGQPVFEVPAEPPSPIIFSTNPVNGIFPPAACRNCQYCKLLLR
jgi:hypothetical protein